MKLQKVAIVCNPKAGTAKGNKLQRLVAEYEARGAEVRLFPTTPEPNSAMMLAKEAQAWQADLIVAFGGDYTVNQVAQGLMVAAGKSPQAMAAFPAGTGNLFARSFYSVPTVESFVRMCCEGEPRDVDVIRYECEASAGGSAEGILLVAFGFGEFSDAIALSSQKWKQRLGPLVYAANVVAALPSFQPHSISLHSRGEQRTGSFIGGFVFNTLPPKGISLSRGCNPSDGKLDFVGMRGQTYGDVARMATSLISGRPDQSRQYTRWVVPELTIKSHTRPMLLNLDGDPGPTTDEVKLKVLPGAVRLLVA